MKRRTMIGIVIGASSLTAAYFGWRWLSCIDRMGSFYSTRAEAVASGAVDRGWLPGTLPSGASNIREEHDVDTNEVWMRFTVGPEEALQFVTSLRRLSPDEVAALTIGTPCDRSWWFEGPIEQEPANDGALNADIYVGALPNQASQVFVAIDRVSPTVYYWSHDFGTSGRRSGRSPTAPEPGR